jgi:predicted nucleic acid-binding protein
MKVIVDTCIWSEAFRKTRKQNNTNIINELTELIRDERVILLGSIRQELLSGIKSKNDYNILKYKLRSFENEKLYEEDYEEAAKLFNKCRAKGIQGSNTDFLICAVALRRNYEIFSTDNDFKYFSKYIKIKLYKIQKHSD